jgi:ABC-2 type transport system permease protein
MGRALGRIFVVGWKELLQVRRDRLTLAMMVALPLMQLMLFGYAINTDVRSIHTVVYDQDWSASSRDFVRRLEATGYYSVRGYARSYDEVERALRGSLARVAVVLPRRYGEYVKSARPAQVQLVVDGSDTQTVGSALNTAGGVASALGLELLAGSSRQRGELVSAAGAGRVSIESVVWYNPEQRTAVYIVPGLAGVILTLTMVMFTSMALARERERGTLEQLMVSPIRGTELVLGKILPYVAIGYLQLTLILVAARVVFDVHVVGALGTLYLLSSLFIAGNLALGLVFSTVAKTQQQAMQMSFFFLLPNILLSGFMFPWEAMPRPVQWLSQMLPLTHFLRIIRGVVLKGALLGDLGEDILWLAGAVLFFSTIATLRFKKKLL